MQQIDEAIGSLNEKFLTVTEYAVNARLAAQKIRNATKHFGDDLTQTRRFGFILALALEGYAAALEREAG